MGNKILAKPCLCIPFVGGRSECKPDFNLLWWPTTNGADQILELLAKTLIFNSYSYYNEQTDKTPEKK